MRAGAALLAAALAAAGLAEAEEPADIDRARALLAEAEQALRKAQSGETRLAAVGRAISAQEAALAALRRTLRQLTLEARAIRGRIETEERNLERVLGSLMTMAGAPRSALLAHPEAPLDAARAAALMGDVRPVLQERTERLRARLERLDRIAEIEAEARSEIRTALATLQELRAEALSALGNRRSAARARPEPSLEAEAAAAARSAETLAAMAETLASLRGGGGPRLGFDQAKGRLPLPVEGEVVTGFAGPDPLGHDGAGWSIAAPAFAQVSAPWDGTVRFAGPLGAYGNVVVLEPEVGYLMVLAGLGRLERRAGEVVLAGEPLGDMGGPLPSGDEFLFGAASERDLIGRETLYLELRHEGEPVDPADWFGQGDR